MNNNRQGRQRKVLVIADFRAYGGTRTYFSLLMDFLLRNECTVCAFNYSWQSLTPSERDYLAGRGVKFRLLPQNLHMQSRLAKMIRLDKLLQFLFFFRQYLAGYDSVIVSTGNPFQFFPGRLIFGSKFVYVSHSYPTHRPSWFNRNVSGICTHLLYRLFRQRAKLIVVSEAAAREVKKYLKAVGIVRGPDIAVVHNTSKAIYAFTEKKDPDSVITIGHVVDYKNPAFWVDVARYVIDRHHQARFIWIGDGPMLEEMTALIPNELREQIIFAGHREDAGEMISGHEIYFQPSLIESQSISVLDAMAQRVPCIVSNRGGLPETVTNGITGYVVNLDVVQAGERILELLSDKELARKMGEAGYEKFHASFSLAAWEKKTREVLFGGTK